MNSKTLIFTTRYLKFNLYSSSYLWLRRGTDRYVFKVCMCDSLKISPCFLLNFKRPFSSLIKPTESVSNVNTKQKQSLNYEEIVADDTSLLKKLKIIELEVDVMRHDGSKVPDNITTDKWKELLNAPTRSQRLKLLSFWFIKEKKKENDRKKKEERQKRVLISREELQLKRESNKHIYYGFGGSSIFLRVYDSTIDNFHNQKLIRAMQFGQNIVIDCSYHKHMNPKESSLCAKQLTILFASNRTHSDPFNIHLCNADPSSVLMKKLSHLMPNLYDSTCPLNITEKSYLELFPKKRLLYLTPHCKEDLNHFSHDDIYIIGGIVDKVNNKPLSLGIAKKEGLRMAKLPLEKYLHWHIGNKSLTLNQVVDILLEVKTSSDWKKALDHVPKRKLFQEEETPPKGPWLYRHRHLLVKNYKNKK